MSSSSCYNEKDRGMSRRRFLYTGFLGAEAVLWFPFLCGTAGSSPKSSRPHILLTERPVDRLQSVTDVRNRIKKGFGKRLWQTLKDQADEQVGKPSFVPSSMVPHRDPKQAKHGNRDVVIVSHTADRVRRDALVCLLTGDTRYRDDALKQMRALFDPKQWPDWRDKAHIKMGTPADLRTGRLAQALALSYDWLYRFLTPSQHQFILDGLKQRAIEPFFQSIEKDEWWIHERNNWMTRIVGGEGIAGMALDADYKRFHCLVDFSLSRMQQYLSKIGPNGEFNESPMYGQSLFYPVYYFTVYHYFKRGQGIIEGMDQLSRGIYWFVYMLLPPGRLIAFGDTNITVHPNVSFFAAIASDRRDPILQWFYLQVRKSALDSKNGKAVNAMELLWFDETLKPQNPVGKLPLGASFPKQGGILVSRTSWDLNSTPCVVYGKAGRPDHHQHNDVGQLCIDGYGKRLIVDLGKSGMHPYPSDYFGHRSRYYNSAVRGHNIFTFGGRDMKKKGRGQIVKAAFDDNKGAYWQLDVTAIYEKVKSVRRTVVFLHPGIVAVLDQAMLTQAESIVLRWHTARAPNIDEQGGFRVKNEGTNLAASIISLDDLPVDIEMKRHSYHPSYNKTRLGDQMKQHHEPYVAINCESEKCQILSLFAVLGPGQQVNSWQISPHGGQIKVEDKIYQVSVINGNIVVRGQGKDQRWQVDI